MQHPRNPKRQPQPQFVFSVQIRFENTLTLPPALTQGAERQLETEMALIRFSL